MATKLPATLANIFGQPKTLKTATALASLVIEDVTPVLVGVRENLEAIIENSLDVDPDYFEIIDGIRDMDDVSDLLRQAIKENWRDPIYFDDLNHKIQKGHFALEDQAPTYTKESGGQSKEVKDGFFAHGGSKRTAFDVFEECRNAGLMVITTAHEASPQADKARKGGPVTPNYDMRQQWCSWFDLNLRFYKNDRESLDPWEGTCMNGVTNHPEWLTGDRYEKCWDASPRSLRELLRASGRPLPFPGEYKHIETIRDATLAHLRGIKGVDVVIDHTMAMVESDQWAGFESEYGFAHMRWGTQEGIAAFAFEQRAAGRRTNFRMRRRSRGAPGTEGGAPRPTRAPTPSKTPNNPKK